MKAVAIALLVGLLGGFGAAWAWQGSRWDADVARIDKAATDKLNDAYAERDARVATVENQKAEVERDFQTFKDGEAKRNADVAAGVKRVYVRATCPAVPGTPANPGGAAPGAVELDPAYRSALSDLRRGAVEQLRLLNMCRAELMAR